MENNSILWPALNNSEWIDGDNSSFLPALNITEWLDSDNSISLQTLNISEWLHSDNSTSLPTLNVSEWIDSDGPKGSSGESFRSGLVGGLTYLTVLVTVIGNGLVLLVVARYKHLQTVFNMYIVNLAVTDILVAVTATLLYSTMITLGYWPFGKVMCGFWIFCDYGMTLASVFTLQAISMDRFWAVKWSHHYKRTNTRKKALIAIALIWIIVLVLWLPACIIDQLAHSHADVCVWDPNKNKEFAIAFAIIGHHGSFLTILFCSVSVLVILRRRAKTGFLFNKAKDDKTAVLSLSTVSHRSVPGRALDPSTVAAETTLQYQPPAPMALVAGSQGAGTKSKDTGELATTGTNEGKNGRLQHITVNQAQYKQVMTSREAKAFVIMSCIVISYMLCWVPYYVLFDISVFAEDTVNEVVFKVAFGMTYINSAINPILYSFFGRDFKLAFQDIFACRSRVKVHPQV